MKDTTVIYKSYVDMMELLLKNDTDWREAMTGLLNFGFDGIVPESNNPLIQAVYVASLPTLRTAKERYDKAVENGKKGGRPTEIKDEDIMKLREEGKSNKEIADLFGVTEKAIEKRVSKIKKTDPTNPTNLNDNVNVNVNVNDNLNLNEKKANAVKTEEKTERVLTDLETEELLELDIDYKKGKEEGFTYPVLQKKYNLTEKLDKTLPSKIKDILDSRKEVKDQSKRIPLNNGEPSNYYTNEFEIAEADLDEYYEKLTDFGGTYRFNKKFVDKWFKEEYNYVYNPNNSKKSTTLEVNDDVKKIMNYISAKDISTVQSMLKNCNLTIENVVEYIDDRIISHAYSHEHWKNSPVAFMSYTYPEYFKMGYGEHLKSSNKLTA